MVNISGGDITGTQLDGAIIRGGTADITGGTFLGNRATGSDGLGINNGTATISGGSFNSLSFNGTSTIDFIGTFSSYAPIFAGPNGTQVNGYITGILADGEAINTPYALYDNSEIEFNSVSAAVPEASTTVSFGLLLALELGGLAVTARRRKTQAGT